MGQVRFASAGASAIASRWSGPAARGSAASWCSRSRRRAAGSSSCHGVGAGELIPRVPRALRSPLGVALGDAVDLEIAGGEGVGGELVFTIAARGGGVVLLALAVDGGPARTASLALVEAPATPAPGADPEAAAFTLEVLPRSFAPVDPADASDPQLWELEVAITSGFALRRYRIPDVAGVLFLLVGDREGSQVVTPHPASADAGPCTRTRPRALLDPLAASTIRVAPGDPEPGEGPLWGEVELAPGERVQGRLRFLLPRAPLARAELVLPDDRWGFGAAAIKGAFARIAEGQLLQGPRAGAPELRFDVLRSTIEALPSERARVIVTLRARHFDPTALAWWEVAGSVELRHRQVHYALPIDDGAFFTARGRVCVLPRVIQEERLCFEIPATDAEDLELTISLPQGRQALRLKGHALGPDLPAGDPYPAASNAMVTLRVHACRSLADADAGAGAGLIVDASLTVRVDQRGNYPLSAGDFTLRAGDLSIKPDCERGAAILDHPLGEGEYVSVEGAGECRRFELFFAVDADLVELAFDGPGGPIRIPLLALDRLHHGPETDNAAPERARPLPIGAEVRIDRLAPLRRPRSFFYRLEGPAGVLIFVQAWAEDRRRLTTGQPRTGPGEHRLFLHLGGRRVALERGLVRLETAAGPAEREGTLAPALALDHLGDDALLEVHVHRLPAEACVLVRTGVRGALAAGFGPPGPPGRPGRPGGRAPPAADYGAIAGAGPPLRRWVAELAPLAGAPVFVRFRIDAADHRHALEARLELDVDVDPRDPPLVVVALYRASELRRPVDRRRPLIERAANHTKIADLRLAAGDYVLAIEGAASWRPGLRRSLKVIVEELGPWPADLVDAALCRRAGARPLAEGERVRGLLAPRFGPCPSAGAPFFRPRRVVVGERELVADPRGGDSSQSLGWSNPFWETPQRGEPSIAVSHWYRLRIPVGHPGAIEVEVDTGALSGAFDRGAFGVLGVPADDAAGPFEAILHPLGDDGEAAGPAIRASQPMVSYHSDVDTRYFSYGVCGPFTLRADGLAPGEHLLEVLCADHHRLAIHSPYSLRWRSAPLEAPPRPPWTPPPGSLRVAQALHRLDDEGEASGDARVLLPGERYAGVITIDTRAEAAPRREVLLVLDASASTAAHMALIRDALTAICGRLGPGDRLKVIGYGSEVKVMLPWRAPDADAIAHELSGGPGGWTALSAGLEAIAGAFAGGSAGDRVVFLITDGLAPTHGVVDPLQLAALARAATLAADARLRMIVASADEAASIEAYRAIAEACRRTPDEAVFTRVRELADAGPWLLEALVAEPLLVHRARRLTIQVPEGATPLLGDTGDEVAWRWSSTARELTCELPDRVVAEPRAIHEELRYIARCEGPAPLVPSSAAAGCLAYVDAEG
ncbi:MAG: VWA domain-containing protein [Myxococcales bacterium]|nr:VWA domain-containing protein [Myxococcales bacterium]